MVIGKYHFLPSEDEIKWLIARSKSRGWGNQSYWSEIPTQPNRRNKLIVDLVSNSIINMDCHVMSYKSSEWKIVLTFDVVYVGHNDWTMLISFVLPFLISLYVQ